MITLLIKTLVYGFYFSWILVILVACTPKSTLTPSQLKLQQATEEALEKTSSAQSLLNSINASNLPENLDNLLLARNLSLEAKQVFSQRDIQDVELPALDELEQTLISVEPLVASLLADNLKRSLDLTTQLREQIVKVKTQPYSARDQSTVEVVKRLSSDYNKALTNCCKQNIALATKILMFNPNEYRAIKKLGLNLDYYMEQVIADETLADALLAQMTLNETH